MYELSTGFKVDPYYNSDTKKFDMKVEFPDDYHGDRTQPMAAMFNAYNRDSPQGNVRAFAQEYNKIFNKWNQKKHDTPCKYYRLKNEQPELAKLVLAKYQFWQDIEVLSGMDILNMYLKALYKSELPFPNAAKMAVYVEYLKKLK